MAVIVAYNIGGAQDGGLCFIYGRKSDVLNYSPRLMRYAEDEYIGELEGTLMTLPMNDGSTQDYWTADGYVRRLVKKAMTDAGE